MKNEKARTVASVRIQIVERILWHKVLGSDELSVFAVFSMLLLSPKAGQIFFSYC